MVESTAPMGLTTGEYAIEEKDALVANAPLPTQSWDDERLAERVESALRATGYGALHRVQASACAGIVILAGRVSSYYLKQVVHETALAVPGAQQIRNGLDVVRPKSNRQQA